MAVYEFVCGNCRKKFRVVKPITAYNSKKVTCPKCRSKNVRRVWGGVHVVTSKMS